MLLNKTIQNEKWNTYKLSELGTFARGKSKHRPRNDIKLFENGKYPLIQTGDVTNSNLFITKHSQVYNDYGLIQSKIWPTGTLCITIAANIAEVGILSYPMCFPDSIVGFNADPKKTTNEFMYYIFKYIQHHIKNTASGSIQDNINIDYLLSLEFKIPPLDIQSKILDILLSIDNAILKNVVINDNLLAQVKTIYDYWFTQFDFLDKNGRPYRFSGGKMKWNNLLKCEIPYDWDVRKIKDICTVTWGQCPEGKHILPLDSNGIDYCSGAGDMKGGFLVDCQAKTDDSRRSAHKNDILISVAGKIGDICVVDHDISLGRAAIAFSPSNEENVMFVFSLLQNFNRKLTTISSGSIQKVINSNHIDELLLAYNEQVVKDFGVISLPIYRKITELSHENRALIKLRDWLLPMLMNGQATVED